MKTKLNLKKLEPHPLGAAFPSMKDDEYKRFVSGIKKNGYDSKEKITLLDGKILDGNHRYTGLKKAGIPYHPDFFEDYRGDDPIGFVTMKNLNRRNLTPSQAAAVGADLVDSWKQMEKDEAANSQTKSRRLGGKSAVRIKGSKTKKAADALGVSERSVASARALKKANPKAHEEVKKGKKKLHAAGKEEGQKQSAEQRKTAEFEEAAKRIDKVCGDGFTLTAAKKLPSKDLMKLSQLDKAEMKRIHPFIEAGWGLKAALGYKSASLSYGHTIRQLRDRAIEQGGRFTLVMDDGWEITALNEKLASKVPGL